MSITYILEKMMEACEKEGVHPSENIEKIARAKNMMFGTAEWYRCPCDGLNQERFCISELCKSDIKQHGVCHCRCYKRDKELTEKEYQ